MPKYGAFLPVARIRGDVVEPDRPFAVETSARTAPWRADAESSRTLPSARPTACTACRRRRTSGSRHVVEERAELRVRQLGRGVGDLLNDRLAVERRGDDARRPRRASSVFAGVLARRRQQARPLGDVARDLRGADDLAARRRGSARPSARSTAGCRPCAAGSSRSGRPSRRRGSSRGRYLLRPAARRE